MMRSRQGAAPLRGVAVLLILALLATGCRLGRESSSQAAPAPSTVPGRQSSGVNPGATQGDRPPEEITALKIVVAAEGIYEITRADLDASGLHTDRLDATQFQLSLRGAPRPLWTHGEGDAATLRFYGLPAESRYTRENVYWLEPGSADRTTDNRITDGVTPVDSNPQSPISNLQTYSATVRLEEQRLYAPQATEGEHWFWSTLPAPGAQTFTVTLNAVAPGPARVRLGVWASTEAPASPDHHLRLALGDQSVADEQWDGQGSRVIETELAAGLLQEGPNELAIEAPGDTGAAADIVFVDWIEIEHPRFLVAVDDRLAFDSGGGLQQLTGFSGPVALYDVTDPDSAAHVADLLPGQESEGGVTFEAQPGHRYVAVGPNGVGRPLRILPARAEPDLRAMDGGADYLAVGPSDLLAALQPLLEWRESQGLRVLAIPTEVLYDQFNHGLVEPTAIQAFVREAAERWQPAPRYLVLVGDATYDPQGLVTPPEMNRLPAFLIESTYGGETASDIPFAQPDEETWPRIAVGRIPARDAGQVRVLVEKTLAYERSAGGQPWQKRVLAVADGREGEFALHARAFLDRFPAAGYETVLLGPETDPATVREQVKQRLNEGSLLVAYFGHGSVTQWGRDNLFTTADSPTLSNGDRLPVVINMTCLTGLFTHPQVESLAESLLWQPQGGAVAMLAPTSLTLSTNQSFLAQAIVRAFLEEADGTIGEVLVAAWSQLESDDAGARDVVQTFLLFGDPALNVARPED